MDAWTRESRNLPDIGCAWYAARACATFACAWKATVPSSYPRHRRQPSGRCATPSSATAPGSGGSVTGLAVEIKIAMAQAAYASDEDKRAWRVIVEGAVAPLLEIWEPIIGVRVKKLAFRNMKSRWGSCQPATGRVCVNTRLALYPPRCLEYVVVHELVHMLEPSHNARFHERLSARLARAPQVAAIGRAAFGTQVDAYDAPGKRGRATTWRENRRLAHAVFRG